MGDKRFLTPILVGLVRAVCRHPRLVLAVGLALCAVSLTAAFCRLEYHTQRTDLVSPDKEYRQRWQRYLEEFGDDEDIVVVVQGADRARMRAALTAIAGRLKARPDCFDRVFYQADLRPLRERALLYLDTPAIEAIRQNLRTMGLLLELGPLSWRSLGLGSLLGEAKIRGQRFQPGLPLEARDVQFLTQLTAVVRAASATLADPLDYDNPWKSLMPHEPGQEDLLAEPQYFFSADGTLASLLVRAVKEPGSFTACSKSVTALRAILSEVRPDFPELEFGLTGLPVLEDDEMTASRTDTQFASLLALVGVALLYYLVYRHWHAPFLTVTTLLVGTIWALGWLTLTVGHLNILSATFAIMLIGMGDYGVLWVTRFERECDGGDLADALARTAAGVGPSIVTAAATTALAFFAAMLADFQAVVELGWIAGSGILLCALACFTILPALICLTSSPSLSIRNPQSAIRNSSWLPSLTRRPRLVVAAGIILFIVLGVQASWIGYDHNLLNMQAQGLDSVRWELTLMERMTGTSWHALSYTASREEALELKARYEKLPGVSRVAEVAALIPGDQEAKLPLVKEIQHRLRKLPARGQPIAHAVPPLDYLRQEVAELVEIYRPLAGEEWTLADLHGALSELDRMLGSASANQARGQLHQDQRLAMNLVSSVGRLSRAVQPAESPDGSGEPSYQHCLRLLSQTDQAELLTHWDHIAQYLAERNQTWSTAILHHLQRPDARAVADRLRRFDERLAGDLAEDLHELRDVAQPQAITTADLPAPLRERFIGQSGQWLLRVFAKESLWDFDQLKSFVHQVRSVDPEATGKPFATLEGLRGLRDGFLWAGLYALAAIVAVLALDFRRPAQVLGVLVPLALGLVGTLGLMSWWGLPLNPANLIALPLILGVGVDNGVHVLHDFLARRRDRRYALGHATGRGILVASLTTIIGFGTLMLSTHRGLASLGLILTLGVGCCTLSALVFLPALLRSLDRPPPLSQPASWAASQRGRRECFAYITQLARSVWFILWGPWGRL